MAKLACRQIDCMAWLTDGGEQVLARQLFSMSWEESESPPVPPLCSALRCSCCDLDGDGRLTPDELLYFYEEQLHRMECLSQVGAACENMELFMLLFAGLVWAQPHQMRTLHCARVLLRRAARARVACGQQLPHPALSRPAEPAAACRAEWR